MNRSLTILIFTLFLIFFHISCSNPCRKVECQNGGVCVDGTCDCPAGYTGENCQTDRCTLIDCENGAICVTGNCQCTSGYYGTTCNLLMQDRFLGTWTASQICEFGSNSDTTQYTAIITAGGNRTEINIYLEPASWVVCTIDNLNAFTIPQQSNFYGVTSGAGTLVNDNTINIDYSTFYQGQTKQCVATLVKQ